ncbi:MAG: hypothetical protein R2795_05155 [Saprospiraceae bacterium]
MLLRNWMAIVLLTAVVLSACGDKAAEEGAKVGNYEVSPIPNTDAYTAVLKDPAGNVMESGVFASGKKQGAWLYYGSADKIPDKLITYVDDQYNGPYMEFSGIGQMQLLANYKNNMLHGEWAKYFGGKPEMTCTYKDGQLDGVLREYYIRSTSNWYIRKEATYKNGKLDGVFRSYDMQGNVVLEYNYANGEKLSGGFANPSADSILNEQVVIPK